MKISATFLLIIVFILPLHAQQQTNKAKELRAKTQTKLTIEEERAAVKLTKAFLKRFQEAQDIAPLIQEFFIEDFSTRLQVCYTSDNCQGFAKDFWKFGEEENEIDKKTIGEDFVRHYTLAVNVFSQYLFIDALGSEIKQTDKGSEKFDEIKEELKPEFISLLLDAPELRSFIREFLGDDFAPKSDGEASGDKFSFSDIEQARKYLTDAEKLYSILCKFTAKLKVLYETQTKHKSDALFQEIGKPTIDFLDDNFFDYPVGTRIIEIYAFPFKIDMIKEKRKLKIIAVYPPMD